MASGYFKKTLKYIFLGTFKFTFLFSLFIYICLIVVDIYSKVEIKSQLLKYSFFMFLLSFLPAVFHLMLQLLSYFFQKEFFNLYLPRFRGRSLPMDIRNEYASVKNYYKKPKDTVFSILFNIFYAYLFFFCLYFSIK